MSRGSAVGSAVGFGGHVVAVAEGAQAWNPVFDVTPHDLIDVLVTERGVITQPDAPALRAVFGPGAR